MNKITQVRRMLDTAGKQFILLFTQKAPHLIPVEAWNKFTQRDPKTLINYGISIKYCEGECSEIHII